MNKFMEEAFKESIKANKLKEIPVGAVIVRKNKIIAKAHNNRQKKYNLLGHAEINAILRAEKKIKDWRLDDAEMYVTLMPCEMCQTFIKESRIKNVYYLLKSPKYDNSNYIQTNDCEELKEKYNKMLKDFFQEFRN